MHLESQPMYLKDLRFRTRRKDGEQVRIVVATLMMEPFNASLCEVFAPGVKSKLFARDGNPTEDVLAMTVGAHAPLLLASLSTAPDLGRPTLALTHVELDRKVVVRRDKETPQYSANVRLSFEYPAANDLLLLATHLGSQFFVELEDQQATLDYGALSEDEKANVRREAVATA